MPVNQSSVPAAEKQPKTATSKLYFGMVICRRWVELVSFEHVWNWDSSAQITWGSFRCSFANSMCFSCVFTEERIEFGYTTIKRRSEECCCDICPSVGFSHLHIWSWSSTRGTISVTRRPFSINVSVWLGGQLSEGSWLCQTSSIWELWKPQCSWEPELCMQAWFSL